MKHLNLTLLAVLLSFISFGQAPTPIIGPTSVCVGSVTTFTDGTTGGTWSIDVMSVATIDVTTGDLTGVSDGTATITYATSGGSSTDIITVLPLPAPVTGIPPICVGATATVTDANTDGTWSATGAASVDPVTGDVTGSYGGSAIVYYTASNGCAASTVVTVNPGPYAGYSVVGGGTYCIGSTGLDISLDASTPGVTYQLINGGLPEGSPVPGSGLSLDFGLITADGTYTVVGTNDVSGCTSLMTGAAVITAVVPPAVHNLTGTSGALCVGGTGIPIGVDMSDAGINYQLYNGLTTVGTPMSGTGSVLSFGAITVAGTYTVAAQDPVSTCATAMTGSVTVTVNPLPAIYTVTGTGGYCAGTAGLPVMLSGSVPGTSYQLYRAGVAVGTPLLGTGASLTFGPDTSGTYTVVATITATGCTSNMIGSAVISATMLTPSVSIVSSPGGNICTGTMVTFGAAPVNGGSTPTYTWSVNGAIAGTGSTHMYVPSNHDTVKVILTSSLPCASPDTAFTKDTVTVITPVISASSSSICGGTDIFVAHGGVSYTWAPISGLSCTTCDTVSIDPTSTIVYTITGTDSYGCIGVAHITADGNRISGHISLTGPADSIEVWLIQYSATDSSLTAIDSVRTCNDGGMPYYQFNDKPAGNYFVKATKLGGTPGTSGYIPTYGLSFPHWDGASGILHGSSSDTMHINLLYGIVSSGPGFISGTIVSGSGKATTLAPVQGMLVYLTDGVSGSVLTYTFTNSAGYYSFPGLANSSYIIYPELYHYYTTPAYVVSLYSGHETVTAIDFKQHNNFGVITPFIIPPSQVNPMSTENGLNVYPNPTNGNLNIQWDNQQTGIANVVVTDVVGRNVYNSEININTASGKTQIDLGGLKNGIYMIVIKSATATYSGKLTIQQ